MKKNKTIILFFVLVLIAVPVAFHFFSQGNVKSAEAQQAQSHRATTEQVVKELQRERALMEEERQKLEQTRLNLKNFEAELNRRYNDIIKKEKGLEDKEKIFNDKVEGKMVDRQVLETYETIDPEQSAILMKNLYFKDKELATLVMKKISGKKAGKILEALIPLDAEVATKIAQDTLNYYRPDKKNK